MDLILIRHAQRVRDPLAVDDCNMPLTSTGRRQAKALANKLSAAGFKPTLYLTSRYAHAIETANTIVGSGKEKTQLLPVAPLRTLTPHEEYTFDAIVQEAADRGYDLRKFQEVGVVLHHPRLNQLLAKLTSRPESPFEPAFAQAVCVRARSLQDFVKGKGLEHCRL
jgi:phosphohistidine phosphatase SixA